DEMRELKEKMERDMGPSIDRFPKGLAEAAHVFEQFAFKDSTPDSRVGEIIQETFWQAGRGAISVFSSYGVLPSDQVRIASDGVAGFVDGIPILPERIMKVAESFVMGLRANGSISDVSITDIKNELQKKDLDNKQLLELLIWASKRTD